LYAGLLDGSFRILAIPQTRLRLLAAQGGVGESYGSIINGIEVALLAIQAVRLAAYGLAE